MNVSRGFSAMSITIVGNFSVTTVEALFEIGQRDAVALGVVGVGGEVGAEFLLLFGRAWRTPGGAGGCRRVGD